MTTHSERRKSPGYKRAFRTQFFKSYGETASLCGWVIFAVLAVRYLLQPHAGTTPVFTIQTVVSVVVAVGLLGLGIVWRAFAATLTSLSDEEFEAAPRWPPLWG